MYNTLTPLFLSLVCMKPLPNAPCSTLQDVQLLLEEVMDEDFQTTCDDGSPAELGDLFCTMWRQCGAGDFTLVHKAMASEKSRADTIARSQGLNSATGDAMDSDDDDEEEDGMEVDDMNWGQPTVPEEPAPPLVDADGFMTAGKKKKKNGKSGAAV